MDKRTWFSAFLVGLLVAGAAFGASRLSPSVQLTARNEGNVATDFAVTCSSTAWTTVKAANTARRALFIQALVANAYGVCVSTYSTSTVTCGDTTVGLELEASAKFTIYDEMARYCRARAGSSGEYLKGSESDDSDD